MYQNNQIGKDAYNAAQMDWIQAAKWEDVDPNEVEKIAKGLKNAAQQSELLYDNMTEEASEDVALYMLRMNKGITELGENFENWRSILDESDSSSQEYIEAMDGMRNAMSDVLGISKEFISDDFLLQKMKDIELAAEGDAEAIDRLAIAAGRDILVNLEIKD
jgi:septation ring formation regulator EzrA